MTSSRSIRSELDQLRAEVEALRKNQKRAPKPAPEPTAEEEAEDSGGDKSFEQQIRHLVRQAEDMLNDAEVIRWDAFPSGHVAIATVALVVALKYHRKTGLGYLPFVTLLPLATVFLGYHYLMDVAFGLLFAAFAFFAIEPAAKWWESIWATE